MKNILINTKNFFQLFNKKNKQAQTNIASAYLAYFLLLSAIPLLLFISQMIVYIVPNFEDFLYNLILKLPNDVQNILNPIVHNIVTSQSSSLSIIAIASALWLGSRGFLGLKNSLNNIFLVNTNSKIPFFDIIFSVIFTILFMLVLALLLLFNVHYYQIINVIKTVFNNIEVLDFLSGILFDFIGKILPFFLSIVLFALFYRYAPSFSKENRISIKESLYGGIIATIGIAAITFFYKFTNDTLGRSPSIYGSLGSVLATLVWLLSVCQMIMFGALFIKTLKDFRKK